MLTYTTQLFPLISITTCIAGSLSHRHCLPHTNRQIDRQTNRNVYLHHTILPTHLNHYSRFIVTQTFSSLYKQTDIWTDEQTGMLTYTTQFFPLIWITIAGSLSHRHCHPCTNIQTNRWTDKQTNKQTGMLTYTTQLFPLISITTCIAGSLSHRHCLPHTNRQIDRQTNRNVYLHHTILPTHLNHYSRFIVTQTFSSLYKQTDIWTDEQTGMLTYTTQFFPLIWITIAGSLSHRHCHPCTNIQTNRWTDKQTNKQTGMLTYTTQLFPLISITTCIAGSLSHRHCLPHTNRQIDRQTNRNVYLHHTILPTHLNHYSRFIVTQTFSSLYKQTDIWTDEQTGMLTYTTQLFPLISITTCIAGSLSHDIVFLIQTDRRTDKQTNKQTNRECWPASHSSSPSSEPSVQSCCLLHFRSMEIHWPSLHLKLPSSSHTVGPVMVNKQENLFFSKFVSCISEPKSSIFNVYISLFTVLPIQFNSMTC